MHGALVHVVVRACEGAGALCGHGAWQGAGVDVREGRRPVAVEEEVSTYRKRSVAPKEDWPSAETIRIDRVLELREHRHSVRHTHAQNATLERTASHQLTAAMR